MPRCGASVSKALRCKERERIVPSSTEQRVLRSGFGARNSPEAIRSREPSKAQVKGVEHNERRGHLMRLELREYIDALHRIIAGIQRARRALAGPMARARSPGAKGPPDRLGT